MSDTHLPWRLWGRKVRPYVLAVSLSTAVIAYACLTGIAVGRLLDGATGIIVGTVAVITVAALWWGWLAKSEAWMLRGLLWSAGVWAAITTILATDVGLVNVNTLLSAAWVIASGGAWLLERGTDG